MKLFALLFSVAALLSGCATTPVYYPPSAPTYVYSAPAQVSHTYIRGPRGGCYYINSNGNKTYVDHSFCR